jgi:hypothetical protein
MHGFVELISAIGLLVWVIGPLARWQYECDQQREAKDRQAGNDSASSCTETHDPLASHPFYRPAKFRRGLF